MQQLSAIVAKIVEHKVLLEAEHQQQLEQQKQVTKASLSRTLLL